MLEGKLDGMIQDTKKEEEARKQNQKKAPRSYTCTQSRRKPPPVLPSPIVIPLNNTPPLHGSFPRSPVLSPMTLEKLAERGGGLGPRGAEP